LLIRWRKQIAFRGLLCCSLAIIVAHLMTVSGWDMWWGGASFGARLLTDLVPWLVLLAVLGIAAMRRAPQATQTSLSRCIPLLIGAVLLLASIFINARGALSWDTWLWNEKPENRDARLLWDWRYPQFLAGLIYPPQPPFPEMSSFIDFTKPDAERYLWYGWTVETPDMRWSDGPRAAMVFTVKEPHESLLELKLGPHLEGDKLPEQSVTIQLNGQPIAVMNLRDSAPHSYSILVPSQLLAHDNVLSFDLPNAASLRKLGVGLDARRLGIYVISMRFAASD
jgi:hypothetical protein